MKKGLRITVAMIAAAALFAVVAPTPAVSGDNRNFTAHCTADQEVQTPAVVSQAQGQAIFHLSKDGTALHYKLIAANIENVTQSHIHLAPVGVNGPVVVFLYPGPTTDGRFDGVLAEGTITAANLIPRPAIGFGGTMSELLERMKTGGAYVNIHTTAYPAGEVRGQIR